MAAGKDTPATPADGHDLADVDGDRRGEGGGPADGAGLRPEVALHGLAIGELGEIPLVGAVGISWSRLEDVGPPSGEVLGRLGGSKPEMAE
jgi:hypothetical protein